MCTPLLRYACSPLPLHSSTAVGLDGVMCAQGLAAGGQSRQALEYTPQVLSVPKPDSSMSAVTGRLSAAPQRLPTPQQLLTAAAWQRQPLAPTKSDTHTHLKQQQHAHAALRAAIAAACITAPPRSLAAAPLQCLHMASHPCHSLIAHPAPPNTSQYINFNMPTRPTQPLLHSAPQ